MSPRRSTRALKLPEFLPPARTGGGFVPGVQVARAIAALLVLAAHVVGLWTNQEQFRYQPWQIYLKVIDVLRIDHQAGGRMGLLLLFLVSGYIVSQAADGDTRIGYFRSSRLGAVCSPSA